MSKQPPPAPSASAVGPFSTLIQFNRMPRHWKFTQHHRTTRPPPPYKKTLLLQEDVHPADRAYKRGLIESGR